MAKIDNTANETETEFHIRNMRHQISALEHQLQFVEDVTAGSEASAERLDQLWFSMIKISEAMSVLIQEFGVPEKSTAAE